MKARSKTSLFLIEMILMVLFFSLSAAVCMQFFASAQTTSQNSRDLNNAVLYAQSAAECYKAANGDPAQTASLLNCPVPEAAEAILLFFDSKWNPVPETGVFSLILQSVNGTADIRVIKNGVEEPLFSLTVKAVGYHG